MATISIQIPDDKLTRIVDGLCSAYGYDLQKESGSTLTKPQFAKRVIIEFIKKTVRDQEASTQTKTVEDTVSAEVNSINIT